MKNESDVEIEETYDTEGNLIDRKFNGIDESDLAAPTEGDEWESEFDDMVDFAAQDGIITRPDLIRTWKVFIRKTLSRQASHLRGKIEEHNARILNHFQLQGTPDMPMIAYDERVCLIPAIEAATKETLAALQAHKEGDEK